MSVQVGDEIVFTLDGEDVTGVVRKVNKVTLDVKLKDSNRIVRVRDNSVTDEPPSTHERLGLIKAKRFSHMGDDDDGMLSDSDTDSDSADSDNQEAGVVE